MSFDNEVLQWINEDIQSSGCASGKLLALRAALKNRSAGSDDCLSKSVEVALNQYERGSLLRSLKNLSEKGFIEIISFETKDPHFREFGNWLSNFEKMNIKLTKFGDAELLRIEKVQNSRN
jgi:hypothetical protein